MFKYDILLRFGDLTLKGKNKIDFVNLLYKNIEYKFRNINHLLEKRHDLAYLKCDDLEYVVNKLNEISGLHSYSIIKEYNLETDIFIKELLEYYDNLVSTNNYKTFKVEVRRSNKKFIYDSISFAKLVSKEILKHNNKLKVDVKNPDLTLRIDIKDDKFIVYDKTIRLLGGFPNSILGKGLLMLSGGIDSPVAGYLSMKQGIEIECIHFESTPLTSLESVQKVLDLTSIISKYNHNEKIKVHIVPFMDLHKEILDNILDSYKITILRRMMYKVATKIANLNNDLVLINGESVGQVASQTLFSINTINEVTNIPILRPLCTYDKQDIIDISKKINTYDISIKPFEDCCTLYVPKSPATKPTVQKCISYESMVDFDKLIDYCVKNTKTMYIDSNFNKDLSMYGFSFNEVFGKINE